MPYRLKNLTVDFISLVRQPANGLPLILKQAGSHLFKLEKMDEERCVAYGIVYAPDVVDSQNDFADRFEIEKAAYQFMKAKRIDQVDTNHDFTPIEGTYIAESWLIKSGDPWFGADLDGAWAVGIKVEDPTVWDALKKGEYWGLSMAGQAEREPIDEPTDEPAEPISKALESLTAAMALLNQQMDSIIALPDQVETLAKTVDQMSGRLNQVEKQRWSKAVDTTPPPRVSPLRDIF